MWVSEELDSGRNQLLQLVKVKNTKGPVIRYEQDKLAIYTNASWVSEWERTLDFSALLLSKTKESHEAYSSLIFTSSILIRGSAGKITVIRTG